MGTKFGYIGKHRVESGPLPSPSESPALTDAASQPTAGRKSKVDPAYLLTVYAIAVAITPEFTFLGIPKVRISDLLLPLVLMVYSGNLVELRKQKKGGIPGGNLFLLMMFWDVMALVVWGKAELTPGVFYLAKRFTYYLVTYAAFAAITSLDALKRVVRALVFTSPILNYSVLHELAFNQSVGGIGATTEGMRSSGIIANQQTSTSLFIVIVTGLALGGWDIFKDIRWRIGTIVALVTGIMAIFATGSRGGAGSLVLCILINCLFQPRRGVGLLVLSGFFVMISWLVTPAALQARFTSLYSETEATVIGLTVDENYLPEYGGSSVADRARVAQWVFRELIPEAHMIGLGSGFKKLGAIDDLFLTEWVYNGFVGLMLFLGWMFINVRFLFQTARRAIEPVERGVAAGVLSGFIAMTASGFHADTFYLIRPMEALSLLLGVVAAGRVLRR